MTALILLAAIIANAFGRRFAGGLLSQWVGPIGGTQVARLVQAAIVGATVAALAPVWWWGLAAALLAFAGATAGFPTGMVPRRAVHYLGLVAHGLMATVPLAAGAWWVGAGWWWLLAAGVLRAPVYGLATLWQPHVPALGLTPDGLPDPPAWAEFWAGGLLGAGLALALM